ncbi:MAG: kelch repeat-containing protein [Blastocatellia bacterium]
MKSEPRIEQMHHLSNGINRAKRTASLLLALVGVMTVTGQTVRSTTQKSTGASIPGDLNQRRSGHTATLLTDGKVVIVGGLPVASKRSSDTELFDPETGTWSVTGKLQAARIGHTATLLTDGKVLVVAGSGIDDRPIASAELYDPATGNWSATGNLIATRFFHTATLLPDGKVLVTGGGKFFSLSSAELYDPSTGTWSETGKLNTSRLGHTATLLQNGKVLVAGGVFDDGDFDVFLLNSAELYDPETGTWSETGSLNTPSSRPSATLLQNGKVLIAGGSNNAGLTDSAELYNPDTGTWSITGNLHVPRRDPATLLPNGKVLVAGGSTAELYDPQTGTWSLTARLNAPRGFHTATLLPDGRVLAAGGNSAIPRFSELLNSSELYDPGTETWAGPVVPVITGTLVAGKRLVLFGENFGTDAVILRNGILLQTKESGDTTKRVAKKGAKKIKPGDKLQVLNRSGVLSQEFVFAGS